MGRLGTERFDSQINRDGCGPLVPTQSDTVSSYKLPCLNTKILPMPLRAAHAMSCHDNTVLPSCLESHRTIRKQSEVPVIGVASHTRGMRLRPWFPNYPAHVCPSHTRFLHDCLATNTIHPLVYVRACPRLPVLERRPQHSAPV